mmetsp:Transcript_34911/g.80746  ORF Transcript_34911/g.80746 Transcript_34911/m.80746 type:complete len:1340 (-) Transcript_34911:54-4073(-)
MILSQSPANSEDSRDDDQPTEDEEISHPISKKVESNKEIERKYYMRAGSKPWDELIYDAEELDDFYGDIESNVHTSLDNLMPFPPPQRGEADTFSQIMLSVDNQQNLRSNYNKYRSSLLEESSFSAADCLGFGDEEHDKDEELTKPPPQDINAGLSNSADSCGGNNTENFLEYIYREGKGRYSTPRDDENWRRSVTQFSDEQWKGDRHENCNDFDNANIMDGNKSPGKHKRLMEGILAYHDNNHEKPKTISLPNTSEPELPFECEYGHHEDYDEDCGSFVNDKTYSGLDYAGLKNMMSDVKKSGNHKHLAEEISTCYVSGHYQKLKPFPSSNTSRPESLFENDHHTDIKEYESGICYENDIDIGHTKRENIMSYDKNLGNDRSLTEGICTYHDSDDLEKPIHLSLSDVAETKPIPDDYNLEDCDFDESDICQKRSNNTDYTTHENIMNDDNDSRSHNNVLDEILACHDDNGQKNVISVSFPNAPVSELLFQENYEAEHDSLFEEDYEFEPEPPFEEDYDSGSFSDESYNDNGKNSANIADVDDTGDRVERKTEILAHGLECVEDQLLHTIHNKLSNFHPLHSAKTRTDILLEHQSDPIKSNRNSTVPISVRPPLGPKKQGRENEWTKESSLPSKLKEMESPTLYLRPPLYSTPNISNNIQNTVSFATSVSSTNAVVDYSFDMNASSLKIREDKKTDATEVETNQLGYTKGKEQKSINSLSPKVTEDKNVKKHDREKNLSDFEEENLDDTQLLDIKPNIDNQLLQPNHCQRVIISEGHALHTHTQVFCTHDNYKNAIQSMPTGENNQSSNLRKDISQLQIRHTVSSVRYDEKIFKNPAKKMSLPVEQSALDKQRCIYAPLKSDTLTFSSSSSEDLTTCIDNNKIDVGKEEFVHNKERARRYDKNNIYFNSNSDKGISAINSEDVAELPTSIFEESYWVHDDGQTIFISKQKDFCNGGINELDNTSEYEGAHSFHSTDLDSNGLTDTSDDNIMAQSTIEKNIQDHTTHYAPENVLKNSDRSNVVLDAEEECKQKDTSLKIQEQRASLLLCSGFVSESSSECEDSTNNKIFENRAKIGPSLQLQLTENNPEISNSLIRTKDEIDVSQPLASQIEDMEFLKKVAAQYKIKVGLVKGNYGASESKNSSNVHDQKSITTPLTNDHYEIISPESKSVQEKEPYYLTEETLRRMSSGVGDNVPEDIYRIADLELIEVMKPELPWIKRRGMTRGLGNMQQTVSSVARTLKRMDSWKDDLKAYSMRKTISRTSPIIFSSPPHRQLKLMMRQKSESELKNLLTLGGGVGVGDHSLLGVSSACSSVPQKKNWYTSHQKEKILKHNKCCIIS